MRGSMRLCTILAVGLIAVSAYGQEIAWAPVGADGPFTLSGANAAGSPTRITLDAGATYRIEFEVRLNGWALAAGAPTLGTYQATLDASGLLGANAAPANPGVDLIQIDEPPYGKETGAYIQAKSCLTFALMDTGQRCDSIVPALPACPAGTFCGNNPRFVFENNLNSAATSVAVPNYAWGAVSNPGNCTADDGVRDYYAATFIFDAPANAAGIYTIGFDTAVAATFINNCAGQRILGVVLTSAEVEFQTGACCTILGGGVANCHDGAFASDCVPGGQFMGELVTLYSPGELCADVACPSCTSNADCDDSNACTNDTCNLATSVCSNVLNYNPATHCCNPGNGAQTVIDDGDVCTVDSCDDLTGAVDHDAAAAAGNACDDGFGCTHSDECDGVNSQADGGCIGDDANDDPCTTDADCLAGTCDVALGLCQCSEDTPLCVNFLDDLENNCYPAGATVNAAIQIGGGSEVVTGGQFLLSYDPNCLDFVSIGPCAGSPFVNVIATNVDEVAGTIFYTTTVDPFAPVGTQGPEDMACLVFTKLDTCGQCDICFESVNPLNTILTNDEGNAVPLDSCGCSKEIGLAGVIDLGTPDGGAFNSDCDLPTTIVEWDTPVASDECDGPLEVVCESQHDGGVSIDHLTANGGEFPQGTSFFVCLATNTCGDTLRKVWTVDVSDKQALDVYVQLSPTMNPGLFSRCITFQLFESCAVATTHKEVLWFDGPYNFDGKARMEFKVDKGQYSCITAQDQLHTLRSADDIECVDGVYYAEFRGDPILGGNWLVGGNLDAWKKDDPNASHNTIDVLDFGQFMNEIASGAVYADGNTDCTTMGPHADINADGNVDNLDYAFILDNYLAASKDVCAGCAGERAYVAVESITVKQLRAQGMGELAVADLNRDGVLDSADMEAYMQGAEPVRVDNLRKESKVGEVRGR